MTTRMIPFGEILQLAPRELVGSEDYPIMSITMHDGLIDQDQKFKKRIASTDTSGYKVVHAGNLVVGFPIDEGVLGFQQKYAAAAVSPAYDIWEATGKYDIDRSYFERILRSPTARTIYSTKMRGTTSRRRTIPKDIFKRIEFPLPPLDEQKRIAGILDAADALRTKRRATLTELDTLLQSTFLDMFGDPVTNPMGWEMTTLPKLSVKLTDGPFGSNLKSSHYVDDGIRVIRLQNVGVGEMLNDDLAYISNEHFASLPRNHCKPGDVIIGTLGDPNLRACIIPEDLENSLNKADCLMLRVDKRKTTPTYVCGLLNCPATVTKALELVRGQTRGRISMGRLKELEVPLPSLDLQHHFVTVVESVEQQKARLRAHLNELDTLFASLQSRAFTGEL